MIDLRKILVPTDFSPPSANALRYAAAFAAKFGAQVLLLHVVPDLALFLPEAASVSPPIVPALDQTVAAARASLERLAAEPRAAGLTVHVEVREGPPFQEILAAARERDVDLIVLGTHGHGGLAHVLLGSVAEKVVRKAPCPVLTVHHPEHDFVHP